MMVCNATAQGLKRCLGGRRYQHKGKRQTGPDKEIVLMSFQRMFSELLQGAGKRIGAASSLGFWTETSFLVFFLGPITD